MLLVIIFISSILASNIFIDQDVSNNKKGLKFYNEQKYDEAIQSFSSINKDKNKDIARFNEGASYYKKGDYKKAQDSFYNSLNSKDVKNQVDSFFNLGNTQFQQKNIDKALTSYQAALDLCKKFPNKIGKKYCESINEEIRNNMQYVFNAKKEEQKQNKQEDQDKQDDQKNKDDKKEDQDNKKQDKQENKEDKQENKEQDNKQNKEEVKQQEQKNISQEQAKQILNIIDSNDTNLQKELLKQKEKAVSPKTGKDW